MRRGAGTTEITIRVPNRNHVLRFAKAVPVALPGETWKKGTLRGYADARGVYVHCAGRQVLYVGNTTKGAYGTFGERLRREFQQKASGHSKLYGLLRRHRTRVRTFFMNYDVLDQCVISEAAALSPSRKALIMEQVLIGVLEPEGNKK